VVQCGAVCCSVVQCVAVWCSVVQCGAVCCSVVQCGAVWCGVLQCVAAYCSVLQYAAVYCSVLQYAAVCCSVLQYAAVYCSVLQARVSSHIRRSLLSYMFRISGTCLRVLQCVAVCSSVLQRIVNMALFSWVSFPYALVSFAMHVRNQWYALRDQQFSDEISKYMALLREGIIAKYDRIGSPKQVCAYSSSSHCNTLQHPATHKLQHTATHCNTLRHTAIHPVGTVCQHTAAYCSTLQHTATLSPEYMMLMRRGNIAQDD